MTWQERERRGGWRKRGGGEHAQRRKRSGRKIQAGDGDRRKKRRARTGDKNCVKTRCEEKNDQKDERKQKQEKRKSLKTGGRRR